MTVAATMGSAAGWSAVGQAVGQGIPLSHDLLQPPSIGIPSAQPIATKTESFRSNWCCMMASLETAESATDKDSGLESASEFPSQSTQQSPKPSAMRGARIPQQTATAAPDTHGPASLPGVSNRPSPVVPKPGIGGSDYRIQEPQQRSADPAKKSVTPGSQDVSTAKADTSFFAVDQMPSPQSSLPTQAIPISFISVAMPEPNRIQRFDESVRNRPDALQATGSAPAPVLSADQPTGSQTNGPALPADTSGGRESAVRHEPENQISGRSIAVPSEVTDVGVESKAWIIEATSFALASPAHALPAAKASPVLGGTNSGSRALGTVQNTPVQASPGIASPHRSETSQAGTNSSQAPATADAALSYRSVLKRIVPSPRGASSASIAATQKSAAGTASVPLAVASGQAQTSPASAFEVRVPIDHDRTSGPNNANDSAPAKNYASDTLDAKENPDPLQWTRLSARNAEAGYEDPALGWVGVRAHTGAGGVHASVIAANADAAQSLNSHLAGLHAYLAERHAPVQTLNIASAENARAAQGMNSGQGDLGDRQAQQSRQDENANAVNTAGKASDPSPSRSELNSRLSSEPVTGAPVSVGGHYVSVMA
jgi:hypothetical protein